LIYGRGLDATDSSKKPNEYAQMMMLFRKDIVKKGVCRFKDVGPICLSINLQQAKDAIV